MTTAPNSNTWTYEYTPYFTPDCDDLSTEVEIPNYRIFPTDDPEGYIAETNADLPGEMQERYALLIAAAPELLSVLEYLSNIMHNYECSVRKGYVEHALALARAAIASARGRAEV